MVASPSLSSYFSPLSLSHDAVPREKSRVHKDYQRWNRERLARSLKRPVNQNWRWVCSECGTEAPCTLHPRAREVKQYLKPQLPEQ